MNRALEFIATDIVSVMERTIQVLTPEGAWKACCIAVKEDGSPCVSWDEKAVAWSILGAMFRAKATTVQIDYLISKIDEHVIASNEHPAYCNFGLYWIEARTTQKGILDILKCTLENIKSEQKRLQNAKAIRLPNPGLVPRINHHEDYLN